MCVTYIVNYRRRCDIIYLLAFAWYVIDMYIKGIKLTRHNGQQSMKIAAGAVVVKESPF